MESARRPWPRVLSMMVLATVLSCQVMGAFCQPVEPALGTLEAIRSAHAGHEMEAMNMCQDSIPSSFTSFKSFETSSNPPADSTQIAIHGVQAACMNRPACPLAPEKGHSLISRLSTFRI